MTDPDTGTGLIGIDWGTSSLRGYRIDGTGAVRDERTLSNGILAVEDGAFEQTFIDLFDDWLAETPCPVVMSGMITSRQGWVELPYVSCPAGRHELSSNLHAHLLSSGRTIHFVTGLTVTGGDGVPDVMRGEETQIIGGLDEGVDAHLFVLPGTHSKWALVADGKVLNFATFMTGELFSVLSRHSILGRLMQGDQDDPAAFLQGVGYARKTDETSGGLLKRLFGSRALGLFGTVPATGAASHLSGLLIGCEIREALALFGRTALSEAVTVLGDATLTRLYTTALGQFDLEAKAGPNDAAARGHFAIARAAGLVGAES